MLPCIISDKNVQITLTNTLVVTFPEWLTSDGVLLIGVRSHGVKPVGVLVMGPFHHLLVLTRHDSSDEVGMK